MPLLPQKPPHPGYQPPILLPSPLLPALPPGAGVLGQELRHLGGSQVEFYTLEYAAALMPHAPTWPLAAAYLAWCPAHGQAALEALLRRLPLEAGDAWPARKAADLAAYHGLHRTADGAWAWGHARAGAAGVGGGMRGGVLAVGCSAARLCCSPRLMHSPLPHRPAPRLQTCTGRRACCAGRPAWWALR